jgi:hypothetical protein
MSLACKLILFAQQFLNELGYKVILPIVLHADNDPAISIAESTGFSEASRSIRVSYHNVRDLNETGFIQIQWTSSNENTADLLTKPLSRKATEKHNRTSFHCR